MKKVMRVLMLLLAGVALDQGRVAQAAEPDVPQLDGWWIAFQLTTALVKLPVLGELESKTRVLSLLHIEQRGLELTIDERVCVLESDVPGPVETEYPAAFRRAISERNKPARLVREGEGYVFEEAERTRLLGVALRDPEREALPTKGDDPRVVDADRDGRPGLTVQVSGLASGRLYVAQRDRSRRQGRFVSPDRVEGVSTWKSEQVVLGATSKMLTSAPDARPHPDPARSPFSLERLPGPSSCAALLQRVASLESASSF